MANRHVLEFIDTVNCYNTVNVLNEDDTVNYCYVRYDVRKDLVGVRTGSLYWDTVLLGTIAVVYVLIAGVLGATAELGPLEPTTTLYLRARARCCLTTSTSCADGAQAHRILQSSQQVIALSGQSIERPSTDLCLN